MPEFESKIKCAFALINLTLLGLLRRTFTVEGEPSMQSPFAANRRTQIQQPKNKRHEKKMRKNTLEKH